MLQKCGYFHYSNYQKTYGRSSGYYIKVLILVDIDLIPKNSQPAIMFIISWNMYFYAPYDRTNKEKVIFKYLSFYLKMHGTYNVV